MEYNLPKMISLGLIHDVALHLMLSKLHIGDGNVTGIRTTGSSLMIHEQEPNRCKMMLKRSMMSELERHFLSAKMKVSGGLVSKNPSLGLLPQYLPLWVHVVL